MTLWKQTLDENEQLAPQLRMAGELLAYMRGRPHKSWLGVRADNLERIHDQNTAPLGVYGSGLWINDRGDPSAAVFVQLGLAPPEGIAASETGYAPVVRLSDTPELVRNLLFVGLPPPQAQSLESNKVALIGSLRGRLGIPIRLPNGVSGFTTAGHNARDTPVVVWNEDGQRIGNVNLSVNIYNSPAMTPTADVAVIELDSPDLSNSGALRIGTCRPFDVVYFQGGVGSVVRGVSPNFALRPSIASWGEVAITSESISVLGDSGGSLNGTTGS